MSATQQESGKPMRFRNYGGIHQFVIADVDDLARIDDLDPAHWTATTAPTRDFQCDPAFLQAIDPEGTGRIRVHQLIAARDWTFERLARRNRLFDKGETLFLDDLDAGQPVAVRLCAAATRVLHELGSATPDRLSLAELRTFRSSYVKLLANGDGVIPPEVVPELEVADFIRDIIRVVGAANDASGLASAGAAELERFLAGGRAYLEWKARGASDPSILIWGADTAAAVALVDGLDASLEAYFWRCDLLRNEGCPAGVARLTAEDLKALVGGEVTAIEAYLSGAPLAEPAPDGALVLNGAVNPVYRAQLEQLEVQVLRRALDEGEALTRTSWRQVKGLFEPFRAWLRGRPAEPFELIDDDRLREYLDGPLPGRLRYYIGIDAEAGAELLLLSDLEKLILMQRWLVELVNNFVNFSALYSPSGNALMEMGTLVIDGRRLEMCLRVQERGAHKKVASDSLIFLIYASIVEREGGAVAYEVVAPVTSGERGRLRPGKRGLFIDVQGREWDAIVTDIVENPISITEAIKSPFRRASKYFTQKLEELATAQLAASETAAQGSMQQGVTTAARAVQEMPLGGPAGAVVATSVVKQPAASPPAPLRDLVLGGGIAFAALGSALAYVLTSLANVRLIDVLTATGSLVIVLVSVSALLGWLKLRRRDMALLFEASGWAINMHMAVTRRVGRVFTRVPPLPPGSILERLDTLRSADEAPAQLRRRLLLLLLLLAAAAALFVWRRTIP